eukprot:1158743-Pelagomonas_calceolata.AAC.25
MEQAALDEHTPEWGMGCPQRSSRFAHSSAPPADPLGSQDHPQPDVDMNSTAGLREHGLHASTPV